MTASPCVTTDLVVELVVDGGPTLPVTAQFGYRSEDPYAVNLHFKVEETRWVTWTFSRSLLEQGVTEAAGEGDVQLWPGERDGNRCTFLHTRSPHGAATFVMALSDIIEFLLGTYSAVPSGTEEDHVDLDAELAWLLTG